MTTLRVVIKNGHTPVIRLKALTDILYKTQKYKDHVALSLATLQEFGFTENSDYFFEGPPRNKDYYVTMPMAIALCAYVHNERSRELSKQLIQLQAEYNETRTKLYRAQLQRSAGARRSAIDFARRIEGQARDYATRLDTMRAALEVSPTELFTDRLNKMAIHNENPSVDELAERRLPSKDINTTADEIARRFDPVPVSLDIAKVESMCEEEVYA